MYYRPVPSTSKDGPKRDGFFLSKKNLSDYSNENPGILYGMAQSIATFLTVSATRAFLMYAGSFEIVKDENYFYFLSSIVNRSPDTGVLTVANHRSMFDDPAILSSILPFWINIQPKYLRWDVCSQEYCFNGKIPALFHGYVGLGKTLPIWRGGGINQKFLLDLGRHLGTLPLHSLLTHFSLTSHLLLTHFSLTWSYALLTHEPYLLAAGEWCHLFPEAGVFQRPTLGGRRNGKEFEIGKLKWGVGKLIAHAPNKIIVIPFFHTGMETVIPQDQTTMKTIGVPIPRPGLLSLPHSLACF